jgi:predicted ATPase
VALRRIVISGCSGGGKSALIDELSSRGFHTFAEAGRIIVRGELETDGKALPWIDPMLFAERLATLAVDQFVSATKLEGLVFFDRCAVEPVVHSQMHRIVLPDKVRQQANDCRYDDPIFMVPPWEEIFVEDTERRHTFREAVAEHDALSHAFVRFGYKVCVIPKMAIKNRIEFILGELGI